MFDLLLDTRKVLEETCCPTGKSLVHLNTFLPPVPGRQPRVEGGVSLTVTQDGLHAEASVSLDLP